MTPLVGIPEAAKLLGVSVGTLRGLVSRGKIAHRRIGTRVLFAPADVEGFVELCRVPIRGPAAKPDRVVLGPLKWIKPPLGHA